MKLDNLRALLVEHLRHLYHAEGQLVKALPKLARACGSDELRKCLDDHANETEQHVLRLEEVFQHLDCKTKDRKCEGMQALIREGKELIDADPEASVLDAGLIAVAQQIEHYEIAAYGCARTWAQELGMPRVADLLQHSLDEETAADKKLTELATRKLNRQAEVGGEEIEHDQPAETPQPVGSAS